ncbi:hypothetical protein [Jeotgalibaca caeni]|uniref:hypothetical protein n=1 Tax=Jeotgalibaca caeni TaxID=3028623 RepID=UPI00237DF1C2|nr:hypothetical protein [Jeotgalibaca caeni]MDE1548251.1 hypothetical protein [Jeotgalibaca caeni]
MKTIITGHVDSLSKRFYQPLKKHSHLLIVGNHTNQIASDERTKVLAPKHWQEQIHSVFSAHACDHIVYFLNRPEEGPSQMDEVGKLVQILDAATTYQVKKIIIVSSANEFEQEINQESRIRSTCLELCSLYKQQFHLPLTVLHIPFLFSSASQHHYLHHTLTQLITENEIHLDGTPHESISFLAQIDLAILIERLLLEPEREVSHLEVPGKTRLTIEEFAQVLQNKRPEAKIYLSGMPWIKTPPADPDPAFQAFRWSPQLDVRDEIDLAMEQIEKTATKHRTTILEYWQSLRKNHTTWFIALEMVLGYLLMSYLSTVASGLVPFRTIDFRLVFVVFIAASHGHKAGISAAVFAQLALFLDYAALEMDWRLLLYNVANWIPFALYLLIGSTLGFLRDQHRTTETNLTEENESWADRYVFLNERYSELMNSKLQIEKKVISSQENFARLFSTLRKLEEAEPARYFHEALHSIEELLQNHSLSFYHLTNNSMVAYRITASTAVQNQIPEKLTISNFALLQKAASKNEGWMNKTKKAGEPVYLYPIILDEQSTILFVIHDVPFDQLNAYQENLFKLTGILLSSSIHHLYQSTEKEFVSSLPQIVTMEAMQSGIAKERISQ